MKKLLRAMLFMIAFATVAALGVSEAKAADEKRTRFFETVGGSFDGGKDGTVQNVVWGYKDAKGKVVIPATYTNVKPFSEGRAFVYDTENKGWRLIDVNGNLVCDTVFSGNITPTQFYNGVAIVTSQDENYKTEYYMINKSGKCISEKYQYIKLDCFDNYLCQIGEYPDNQYGVIDKNGKTIIPFGNHKIYTNYNAYNVSAYENGVYTYTYYAKNGKELASGKDIYATSYSNCVWIINRNTKKSTLYDAKTGKKLNSITGYPVTSSDTSFANLGLCVFTTDHQKYGIVNNKGKIVVKATYEEYRGSNGDYAALRKKSNSPILIFNSKGKEVKKLKANEHVRMAAGGLMLVCSQDKNYKLKYRIINVKGKTVVKDGLYDIGYGNIINDDSKKEYSYFNIKKNGKCGIVNTKGKVIIKPEFDEIELRSGYFVVKKGSNYGLYTYEGKKVLNADYSVLIPRVDDIRSSSSTSNIYAKKSNSTYEYYEADGTLIGKSSAEIYSNIY